jgi:hypothetical protein
VPRTLVTVFPFILLAIASSLLSLLRGIEPVLGISAPERILRALLTLGIGLAIYFTVSLLPRTPEDLRAALRWMYAGLALALAWGSLQVVYVIHFIPEWYSILGQVQRLVSSRRLMTTRISGLTYEPNWFAEQITFLFLPWLLASVLSGTSVFRWRWRWITVELLLLGWSSAILAFTFSRAGLANLIVLAFLGLLFFRPQRGQRQDTRKPGWKIWARRLVEVVLVMAVLAGLIRFAGSRNAFFARIWGYWLNSSRPTLSGYFEYLGFGARFIYGTAAYNTYTENPVLGVGLGNFAFYFEEMLPDRPLAGIPEVLRIITPDEGRNRLITAKVFYLRLLAETGLAGTAAFFAFLIAILGCALFLWLSPEKDHKFWGRAGLLGLIAFLMSAFSFDSFAIPNMWVVFGLITASTWVYLQPEEPVGQMV